ncbi:MAG: hypothetical protein AAGB06_01520 [Verrucomicrobiota bacterium]
MYASFRKTKPIFLLSLSLVSASLSLSPKILQADGSSIQDTLKSLPTLYQDSEGYPIQRFKLYFAYMHQWGYVSGDDRNGEDFDDGSEEIRRLWAGIEGDLLNYFGFKAVSQLSNDRHNFPGGERQFGHETFRSANLTFRAHQAFDTGSFDSLTLGYGRRSGRMADEWQRSATHINTLERSAFSNKIWLSDQENGNPLAAWIKGDRGRHTFDFALFSGTYDDWIGGWNDSLAYYLSWEGDFQDSTNLDTTDVWFSLYFQDADPGDQRLAKGNEWAGSLVTRWGNSHWDFHTTLAFGENGEQTDSDREGKFWGLVLQPMYWLHSDKQRIVARYQFQASERPEGIRLNSRYARLGAAQDTTIDINSGRGDFHHSLYLGYNYHIFGDHLKIISGFEWESLKSNGETLFEGWSIGSGLRIFL